MASGGTTERARFKLTGNETGPDIRLVLEGELDVASAPVLLETLEDAAHSGSCKSIGLDVSALSYIDSTGIGVLVTLEKRARASGITLSMSSPTEEFIKLLDVMGLREFFAFDAT